MTTMTTDGLIDRLADYRRAQAYTLDLIAGLDPDQIAWRPHPNSSAIGWHLGHQAAVNHYLVRNLTAAEPTFDASFDRLFDSATIEPERGVLPSLDRILAYRSAVTDSTEATIERIAAGDVGAPDQLALVAAGMLVALVNHEYQHDAWITEVRATLGTPVPRPFAGGNLDLVDGYLVLAG